MPNDPSKVYLLVSTYMLIFRHNYNTYYRGKEVVKIRACVLIRYARIPYITPQQSNKRMEMTEMLLVKVCVIITVLFVNAVHCKIGFGWKNAVSFKASKQNVSVYSISFRRSKSNTLDIL